MPIAVVPFGGQAEGGPNDVAAVIASDLQLSGRFKPLERRDLVARPTRGEQVRFEDWRLLKSDFLVIGRVAPEASGLAVEFELFNVQTGQQLLTKRLVTSERGLRATAHRIADLIFERLTGIPGAFSTRIAYVAVDGRPPAQRYRLMVADADGYGPRIVTESSEPIMSPAWSPDGQSLAYVSFEGKASAIYVQRLATGDRRRVSARSGINGAPAWSPDGRKLALTLSRDGNLDLYVLDLATQGLTRLTSDSAIDTEPEWSRDGASDLFHVGPGRAMRRSTGLAPAAARKPSASPSPTGTTRGPACRRMASRWRWSRWTVARIASRPTTSRRATCTC